MKRTLIYLTLFLLISASMGLAADGAWTKKTDMPTARGTLAVAVVNGKIYAIGGVAAGGWSAASSAVEEYDPVTDTWTKKADMPTPRITLTAATVNGKIYAIGGALANLTFTTAVEEYDPATDTWSKRAALPAATNWHGASVVEGKIYVIGGPGGAVISNVYEYDPVKDKWTTKANMLTGRWGLSTAVVDGKIYAIGGGQGWNGGDAVSVLSVVEEYDPATDTWTKKADMPNLRAWMANDSPVIGGKIYVIGGWKNHGGAGLSTVEVYDPATDSWTRLADVPTARGALASCQVNSKIYAIGGLNFGTRLSIVEVFDTGFRAPQSVNAREKLATTWGKLKQNQ